jgi:hypothetical protein
MPLAGTPADSLHVYRLQTEEEEAQSGSERGRSEEERSGISFKSLNSSCRLLSAGQDTSHVARMSMDRTPRRLTTHRAGSS